jgi:hypothetical protein
MERVTVVRRDDDGDVATRPREGDDERAWFCLLPWVSYF